MFRSVKHGDFLKILKSLGYDLDSSGVCFGYASKVRDAIIYDDVKTLLCRIQWLSETEDVKTAVEQAYQASVLKRKLLPKEEIALWFRCFCEEILVYQEGHYHTELYAQKAPITQSQVRRIDRILGAKYFHPDGLRKIRICQFTGIYSAQELHEYFFHLRIQLSRQSIPIPILLSSINHAITIEYKNNKWYLYDINKLPFVAVDSIAEIIDKTLNAFFCKKLVAFTTTIDVASKYKTSAEEIISAWRNTDEVKRIYNVFNLNNDNKATLEDDIKGSWLYQACLYNKIVLAEKLIKNHACPLVLHPDKDISILHVALNNGFDEIAMLMLKANASINERDHRSNTPLHIAARNGNTNLVLKILDHPYFFSLNGVGDVSVNALEVAADRVGQWSAVKQLIHKYYADSYEDFSTCRYLDDWNALHMAIFFGHAEIVAAILERVGLTEPTSCGLSCFELAAVMQRVEILELLHKHSVQNQAYFNLKNNTFNQACYAFRYILSELKVGNHEVTNQKLIPVIRLWDRVETEETIDSDYLSYLLAADYLTETSKPLLNNLLLTQDFFYTLSAYAFHTKDELILSCKSILNMFGDVNIGRPDRIAFAFHSKESNNGAIIGFDFLTSTWTFFNAKKLTQFQTDCVNTLIKRVFDLIKLNQHGFVFLKAFIINSEYSPCIFEQLDAHFSKMIHMANDQYNFDRKINDLPVLLHAIHDGTTEVAQLMIDFGADPNVTDTDGKSALCYAYDQCDYELIAKLLEVNANPNCLYSEDITLIQKARYDERREFVMLLEKYSVVDVECLSSATKRSKPNC